MQPNFQKNKKKWEKNSKFSSKKNLEKNVLKFFFQIHKIYHLGLLCTNFQCSGIILYFFQILSTDKKVHYLFFWLYTKNLKKVFKYTQSLVSKTTWKFLKNSTALGFSKKISIFFLKTCMGCHENLKKIKIFTWF